jgi:hypothetical protein
MTGAIASVACNNGKLHHFVCIKKDGSLGHVIAFLDDEDKVTWMKGNLAGQAHPQSQIAIGCPNPTEPMPELDVLFQRRDGGLEALGRGVTAQNWSHKSEALHVRHSFG